MSANPILQKTKTKTKHENMLIDFIWLNVQAKYLRQTILYHFKWNMKVTQMPPVHAANLVANRGNTAEGVDVITDNKSLIVCVLFAVCQHF